MHLSLPEPALSLRKLECIFRGELSLKGGSAMLHNPAGSKQRGKVSLKSPWPQHEASASISSPKHIFMLYFLQTIVFLPDLLSSPTCLWQPNIFIDLSHIWVWERFHITYSWVRINTCWPHTDGWYISALSVLYNNQIYAWLVPSPWELELFTYVWTIAEALWGTPCLIWWQPGVCSCDHALEPVDEC